MSLRVASGSLAHAPTLDDSAGIIERMRQELEHLEHSVVEYAEHYGEDLAGYLRSAAATTELPGSWSEAVVAQLVLSLASQTEVRYLIDRHGPTRPLLRRLADKTEHIEAARAALRDLLTTGCADREAILGWSNHWLAFALATLDEDVRTAYLTEVGRAIQPAAELLWASR